MSSSAKPLSVELIHPHAGRDRHGALEGAALVADLGGRTRLGAQLPARGIDEAVELIRSLETQTRLNFLTPMPSPPWSSIIFMKTSFLVLLL